MKVDAAAGTAAADVPASRHGKLKKACEDFEAIFLNSLIKSMRKTVSKSSLFGSNSGEDMFRDMMDSEICNMAARTKSAGIADMIYKQLSENEPQERENAPDTQVSKGRSR